MRLEVTLTKGTGALGRLGEAGSTRQEQEERSLKTLSQASNADGHTFGDGLSVTSDAGTSDGGHAAAPRLGCL